MLWAPYNHLVLEEEIQEAAALAASVGALAREADAALSGLLVQLREGGAGKSAAPWRGLFSRSSHTKAHGSTCDELL